MWYAFKQALKVAKLHKLERKLQALTRNRQQIKVKALAIQVEYENVLREQKANAG
jgi:hypothetical protein